MTKHRHTPGGPLDYDFIADGIYIGTNQCCVIGIAEVLKKEGINADISLEDGRLDQPFGVEEYLWLPTPDHMPPTGDQLGIGVEAIDALIRRHKKIYAHCKNGHGRAPTLVAAYFISKGHTPESAFAIIKEHRLAAHLQDSQMEALQVFARQF